MPVRSTAMPRPRGERWGITFRRKKGQARLPWMKRGGIRSLLDGKHLSAQYPDEVRSLGKIGADDCAGLGLLFPAGRSD
jgi:hypothetical protein